VKRSLLIEIHYICFFIFGDLMICKYMAGWITSIEKCWVVNPS